MRTKLTVLGILILGLASEGCIPRDGCSSNDPITADTVVLFAASKASETDAQATWDMPLYSVQLSSVEDGSLKYERPQISPGGYVTSADGACKYAVSFDFTITSLTDELAKNISDIGNLSGREISVGAQFPAQYRLAIRLESELQAGQCALPPPSPTTGADHYFMSYGDTVVTITEFRPQPNRFHLDSGSPATPKTLDKVEDYFMRGTISVSVPGTPLGTIQFDTDFEVSLVNGIVGYTC